MNESIEFLFFALGVFGFLIWNHPAVLVRIAAWVDRKSAWLVQELRVQAMAKSAGNKAYEEAKRWHREHGVV